MEKINIPKGRFLMNVLDKINSSKNLQKLAVREGSFCKFLDELSSQERS